MSQHESTRVRHESAGSRHESTGVQHESTRVNTSQLDHEIIIVYRSLVGKL